MIDDRGCVVHDVRFPHPVERVWASLTDRESAGESTFKYDLGSEEADGAQDSTVSVFVRDADGTVRHTYSAKPRMADDIDQRGIDLLCATWHLLDLTPQGRGEWFSSLSYWTTVAGVTA